MSVQKIDSSMYLHITVNVYSVGYRSESRYPSHMYTFMKKRRSMPKQCVIMAIKGLKCLERVPCITPNNVYGHKRRNDISAFA